MTSDVVIRAEGLGKKYVIGHRAAERERYTALRDVIARSVKGYARAAADFLRGRPLVVGDTTEEFWALKDVSFEVKRGEVVGIIGRNGAGKSTLLKILSRITEPTEGRVEIRGRVSSLLEVGTGFHPELTGRENIYLNGAILGMTRAEIRRKFDEIVAFAEVEKFLDTPVKRYSSGMYVRLAFAVAAHLEPEILIVDEVLAVGDAEFQKKCLGKMGEVAGGGRTVLFVSHNMGAVQALCHRAVLLANGKLLHDGDATSVVDSYTAVAGSATVHGRQINVAANILLHGERPDISVRLEFAVTLRGPLTKPHVAFGINDSASRRLATVLSETDRPLPSLSASESLKFRITTEPLRFAPGTLLVKIALADHGREIEAYDDAIRLIVEEYSPFLRSPHAKPRGSLYLRHKMQIHDETAPKEWVS
jgi:ABC-type polysaccharide/polyol phosphate transport system ATPase subunit